MATPLFHLKADTRNLSGVEINLGELGSVLSTATNSDALTLRASSLSFSNGSQILLLSKTGINASSNDLQKTITLLNENVSNGLYFKDFTNNASYPAKTELTSSGLILTSDGVSGNSINMTSSTITVGGTSVSWANVIASGSEIQELQAVVPSPNASTLTIVNALTLKDTITGTNKIDFLATGTTTAITQLLNGYTSIIGTENAYFSSPSGSCTFSTNGMLCFGNDGTRLRITPNELSHLLPTDFSIFSAGSLSISSPVLNVSATTLNVSGPTLIDSNVSSMVVTSDYLPVEVNGVQYYISLSKLTIP